MINNLIFDFDGTLVNSMPAWSELMTGFLDAQGIAYGPELIPVITPMGYPGVAAYYAELGVPMAAQDIQAALIAGAVDAYTHRVPAKSNVPSVLRQLRDRGFSLHVLTASPHATLDPCLKRLELFHLFENVWSCDDFFTTKSDPRIYRMAADRIGVPMESILFLDDNLYANRTAKAAGMRTCGVYDDTSRDYVEELKAAADFYIHDFQELPALDCLRSPADPN